MLVVKSENFATSSHLLCEDTGFVWSSTIPETAVFADTGQRSFSELAKIFGYNVESFISENYKNSAETIGTNPPWYFYIGKEKFIARIKEYSKSYKAFCESFDHEKINIQASISQFIDELQPANFDRRLVKPEYSAHFEKSIQPFLIGSILPPPKYSRTKTKTGRMSVIEGPNVLTCHAGLRSGLVGAHQIDFVSMEPNFLLQFIGKKPTANLYDDIRKEIFRDKISRAKVKVATISALYGSDRKDKFARTISDYFHVEEVIKSLEEKIVDDTIRNEYGRLIYLQGARGRHLLSLWLQSSAADGALYGFYNFSQHNDIKPMWIIHDALIFIGNEKAISVKELDIGFNTILPVKVDKL
tara:strand:- start:667 stop:1737 length:1071 start_codon:yes stop_codon:yes gene_type:complete